MAHLHPDKLRGLARLFVKKQRKSPRGGRNLNRRLGASVRPASRSPKPNMIEALAARAAQVGRKDARPR